MTTPKSGLFSGVVLTKSDSGDISYRQYHKYEHYTAENKYNIWCVFENEWNLLSDESEAPLEFLSKEDAEEYIKVTNLVKYTHKDRVNTPDGVVVIRSAPKYIHNLDYLGLSEADAADTLNSIIPSDFTDDEIRAKILKMLQAKNCGEQSEIWLGILNDNDFKRRAAPLQYTIFDKKMLYPMYTSDSYHSILAGIVTIFPINVLE